MAKRTLDERPEVKIEIHATDYPDQVVTDMTIPGADEAARNKVKMYILQAVNDAKDASHEGQQ